MLLITRLQRLSSGGATPSTPPDDSLPELGSGGSDILTMYQSQWATMHHMAVQNASLAQVLIYILLSVVFSWYSNWIH